MTELGGRAIVVATNFRLGNFGFLALKELSMVDPRGVSGNLGILDIQMALQWVQDNAVAFGGDNTRVTLIGQSSGGTNILSLLASPASVGMLFVAKRSRFRTSKHRYCIFDVPFQVAFFSIL